MSIFAKGRAVTRLSHRCDDLTDRIGALETANKRLGLEWEELYDKVRHQMSRMARRQALEQPENGELLEGVGESASALGMDPISAKIHARRGLGRQNG